MCTVVILRRPGHAWPLLLAANRDERIDRAWDPPAEWWPEAPGVIGGRDRSGGGSWMALGPHGIVAAILNRPGSLGPEAGKRSRGELPLRAAAAATAAGAADDLLTLEADAWRPFNMVVADARDAFFLRATGFPHLEASPLEAGITMVTAHDPNDPASPRIARHLPRFQVAPPPAPERGDWTAWAALLADDSIAASLADTLFVPPTAGFGTTSSSLLALGADGARRWRFASGGPAAPYRRIA